MEAVNERASSAESIPEALRARLEACCDDCPFEEAEGLLSSWERSRVPREGFTGVDFLDEAFLLLPLLFPPAWASSRAS